MEVCQDCVFWVRNPDIVKRRLFRAPVVRESEWGWCRRFPRQFDAEQRGFRFPDAYEDDGCGEWREAIDEDDGEVEPASGAPAIVRLVGGSPEAA